MFVHCITCNNTTWESIYVILLIRMYQIKNHNIFFFIRKKNSKHIGEMSKFECLVFVYVLLEKISNLCFVIYVCIAIHFLLQNFWELMGPGHMVAFYMRVEGGLGIGFLTIFKFSRKSWRLCFGLRGPLINRV